MASQNLSRICLSGMHIKVQNLTVWACKGYSAVSNTFLLRIATLRETNMVFLKKGPVKITVLLKSKGNYVGFHVSLGECEPWA